jgi:hypothetical protein
MNLPPLPVAGSPAGAAAAATPPQKPAPQPDGAASAEAKPARKPIKIDPALLERALSNRYTTPE